MGKRLERMRLLCTLARHKLIYARHEQLLALGIPQYPHGTAGMPTVFEVMGQWPFPLVTIAPVVFTASGGNAGSLSSFPSLHHIHSKPR